MRKLSEPPQLDRAKEADTLGPRSFLPPSVQFDIGFMTDGVLPCVGWFVPDLEIGQRRRQHPIGPQSIDWAAINKSYK